MFRLCAVVAVMLFAIQMDSLQGQECWEEFDIDCDELEGFPDTSCEDIGECEEGPLGVWWWCTPGTKELQILENSVSVITESAPPDGKEDYVNDLTTPVVCTKERLCQTLCPTPDGNDPHKCASAAQNPWINASPYYNTHAIGADCPEE